VVALSVRIKLTTILRASPVRVSSLWQMCIIDVAARRLAEEQDVGSDPFARVSSVMCLIVRRANLRLLLGNSLSSPTSSAV